MKIVKPKTFLFGVVLAIAGVFVLYELSNFEEIRQNFDDRPLGTALMFLCWLNAPVTALIGVLAISTQGRKAGILQLVVGMCTLFIALGLSLVNDTDISWDDESLGLTITAGLYFACAASLIFPSIARRKRVGGTGTD